MKQRHQQKKNHIHATPSPQVKDFQAKRRIVLTSPPNEGGNPNPRYRPTGASRIADSIEYMTTAVPQTVHGEAIKILSEQCHSFLTDSQMIDAYKIMVDKAKSSVFIKMPANRCRKLWLLMEIGADITGI